MLRHGGFVQAIAPAAVLRQFDARVPPIDSESITPAFNQGIESDLGKIVNVSARAVPW